MPSKGNEYLVEAMPPRRRATSRRPLLHRRRGRAAGRARSACRGAAGSATGSSSSGSGATSREALSAFDLVVFPSLWEGTPLTVLEALAMGKPIVSTDADGLQDVLTDGYDARMVPRRQPAALADAIVRWRATAERARLGANARQTGAQLRHRSVREEDGAALRAAARDVTRDPAPERARSGCVVSVGGESARELRNRQLPAAEPTG